jgi:polyisoprenoid-binding protein YceI
MTPEAPIAVLLSGLLSFSGHATVGDFVGSTTTVTGALVGDPTNAGGWVESPVATLVTHNEHRDRDLRASMETAKYPTMRFSLAPTTVVGLLATGSQIAVLRGSLSIHGVTHDVSLPATIERGADTIRVTSTFPLDLGDYRIGGLTKMLGLLRMDPRIDVHVDLRFLASSPMNP